uniref:Uncharacterized protein n=1 Tax=Oryza sativa subsp. japonica TaxID=39947 RepID=Q6YVK8_ORYSJ|nr:hypothetical protein [Oryza sativa Japonica Group]BAD31237.1 hypothetical protein [Oryza sativa Japonica Group]
MWKYGSALQQRPELNPYSTRAEGRGARTGSTGVGPTRQPHGPRWTGRTRAHTGRHRGSHASAAPEGAGG